MHDYDMKMLNFTFYGGQKQAVMNFFFFFLDMSAVPKNSTLNKDEQALCEGLITEKEVLNALKDSSANKTPSTDGLPIEFLKLFWPELQSSIVDSFNYAFQSGSLSISQRRGIISLIPKKNKD